MVRVETSPEDLRGMDRGRGYFDGARRHEFARGAGGAADGQGVRVRAAARSA